MSRRRRTPWLHRWSRPIIGAIAVLGATNTLYLTITRFLGSEAACPTDGCQQVLSSGYATVFGQPLALFGLLAYVAMAIFALGPLLIKTETQKDLRIQLENTTWLLLFLGATAMMIFSGYLMFIMTTEFVIPNGLEALCIYCVASAIFATAMFILTIIGRSWDDVGQIFFPGIIVAVITLVATLLVFAPVGQPIADGYNVEDSAGKVFFSITETSTPAKVELAKHLKETKAVMYGAYWCPHCTDQKRAFGVEAIASLPYIECDPKGKDAKPKVCQSKFQEAKEQLKKDVGFPTWEINGKFYSGAQPLSDLAQFSNYQGPQEF